MRAPWRECPEYRKYFRLSWVRDHSRLESTPVLSICKASTQEGCWALSYESRCCFLSLLSVEQPALEWHFLPRSAGQRFVSHRVWLQNVPSVRYDLGSLAAPVVADGSVHAKPS